jgi:dynein heavy chain
MRALKAILTAAGQLKRQMDEKEDILALIALMDVNLPKFTLNDIPLFRSITSDLFPGIELPEREYTLILNAIAESCQENNWIQQSEFVNKCIQLYDTIMVRHGLMIVGDSMSGKTAIIQCLAKYMCKLHGVQQFNSVEINKLNPKSIMMNQLYGLFDNDTKQWTDGVLPKIMRELATQGDLPERKWIVFDGPVDAVWIENMNTVLDDNKKLCLTSGEIIKLTKWMTMMFEVEDL